MDWSTKAIGLVTKAAGWKNPAFDFIIGYAGGNWTGTGNDIKLEPNEALAPIERQARAEGKPFLALWDFEVDYYSEAQFMADDKHWPPLDNDYPYKACIAALESRDIDGLIVRVMNRKNLALKNEMMTYVAYAANKFITRVNEWLYSTKGLTEQTMILTADPFLRQDKDGAQEYFYAFMKPDFPIIAVEQKALGLVEAYPGDAERPAAIGNTSWKFWYYWFISEPLMANRSDGLMLFNGDAAALRGFLGLPLDTPPVDPGTPDDPGTPTDPGTPVSIDLKPVVDLLAQISTDVAWIRKDVHDIRLKFS
jgi:hypothetical protein